MELPIPLPACGMPHVRLGETDLLGHRLSIFDATRNALSERASDPQELLGAVKLGFQMMLHTWGQLMLGHLHTHVVVLGGGMRLDGSGWVSSPGKAFFLNEERLADAYRDDYLSMLRQLYQQKQLALPGKLAYLQDEVAFEEFCKALGKRLWVIDCGSPEHCDRPESALKYLSRYVVGAVISDHRIVKDEDGQVTIRVKDYRNGKKRTTTQISGVEFVRRFVMHILPARFHRVRYGGFVSGRLRKDTIAAIREQLGVAEPEESEELDQHTDSLPEDTDAEFEPETDYPCVKCGALSMKWLKLIPAKSGWQSYSQLAGQTLPRRVRDRLQVEAAAESAAHRQQLAEQSRARPP